MYDRAKAQSNERVRNALQQSFSPRKLWSQLKSPVIGLDSCTGPVIDSSSLLISEPKAKAEILSQFLDEKQCKDKISVPLSCHPEPKLMSIAFRSRDLCKILSYLDEHGGTYPDGIFPMFLKKTYKEMSPKLAIVFHLFIIR